jgi:CDP-diacylglycerol--glycerol-3-phosphate 3-phosphatidyltransferase
MFMLVSYEVFPLVPVLLIAGREVAVSVYRTVVGARGVSVPAKRLAKAKTVTQQVAVAFALLPITARDASWSWTVLLWAAVGLTLVTGWQYFAAARRSAPAPPLQ